ncbi:sialate O-acetylesterase [Aquisalinus flavus]|uniref:9-O-acetylesterase n=1 Tax=Aquisalinus flavus TaxID=1526572 RepID=A0A8J2V760_9PROT|nr:sialate O-acetylesterase [Aquisalinus flavus]MBD0425604.1 beta galactosidase jelly roll domain-containing protein [Aquisalinus flavus]UNE48777.1 sialate O-acetylesterase [Aquisalinus flavus]GGD14725.1 9-O-acetylesterase [Aquisalinus flavus]
MLKSRFLAGAIGAVSVTVPALSADAAPQLAQVFTDHMVIQRDRPVPVWGVAEPGEKLSVSFNGRTYRATADRDGRWQVDLDPIAGGGPFALSVSNRDGAQDSIADVMAGDVFLCSGQSNMEYPVERALNPGRVLGQADDSTLRLLKVPKATTPSPADDFGAAIAWQHAGADSVAGFSAVCYFFAKDLQADVDVAIGLIDSSWGGSQIEAWMSAAALTKTGLDDDNLALLSAYAADPADGTRKFGAIWEDWWAGAMPSDPAPWTLEGSQYERWKPVPTPHTSWTLWENEDTGSHNGIVYYATTLSLTADEAAAADTLALGQIDELDVAWINGEFVNATFGWGTPRSYDVPQGAFREGENTIVVSVYSAWDQGGMTGPTGDIALKLDGGETIPLGDSWTYKVIPASVGAPPSPPWTSVTGLTGMYNAMIAPLGEMPLTAALWYQGESDAGQPETYDDYLAAMIEDWRGRFGSEMPFGIVQLANFGVLQSGPVESGWAGLREAQRAVAAADEHTGLIVSVDAGNPRDIHPADKLVIGQRAARLMRDLAYGQDVATGPMARSSIAQNGTITVSFDEVNGSLAVIGGTSPNALELCPAGGEPCRYVSAAINGSELEIDSDVTDGEIRYCWADAPICTLYDEAGLPAAPFGLMIQLE